ncbi:MAG: hypothetical protein HYZ09_01875 [Candidatus Kerfeldbacteria bacterium]|nr:hypothetical protein [Candidatus Kerfeldbacteria bacterium]
MPLVATALLPHAPLLAPHVGRENRRQLRRTLETIAQINAELYALKPSVIVVLTPHGQAPDDSFFVNVAETFSLDLRRFGDLETMVTVRGNPTFAYRLRRAARRHRLPVTLGTNPAADYGVTVPLALLTSIHARVSVIPISMTTLPLRVHEHFGRLLADTTHDQRERIAIIGSMELGHHPSADQTSGARRHEYDRRVVQAIREGQLAPIMTLDAHLVETANTCAQRVLATLSGVLGQDRTHPSQLSYEAPFGVGELAALFPRI